MAEAVSKLSASWPGPHLSGCAAMSLQLSSVSSSLSSRACSYLMISVLLQLGLLTFVIDSCECTQQGQR